MSSKPSFLWDVPAGEEELRQKLSVADPDARAQWQGWVMAEARFNDVWRYLSLAQIIRDWSHIERHLGRKRAFWQFLLDGWRALGLVPS